MRHQNPHLPDEELLRAIDGELPPHRQAAADAHLASCPVCRARGQKFNSVTAAVAATHAQLEPHVLEDARQKLRAALRVTAVQMEHSWRFALESVFMTTPRWAFLGAALAATGVLAIDLRPQPLPERVPLVASIEHDALPVPSLTPGAILPLGIDELCARDARHGQQRLPARVRQDVLRRYAMEHVSPDDYELDYLITPELGGAPEPANLWPERYGLPRWNARVKDQLEDLLPRLVCSGQLPLEVAQREIAVDWISAYRKYFNTSVPLPSRADVSDQELMFEMADVPSLTMAGTSATPAMTLLLFR